MIVAARAFKSHDQEHRSNASDLMVDHVHAQLSLVLFSKLPRPDGQEPRGNQVAASFTRRIGWYQVAGNLLPGTLVKPTVFVQR